jgi:16S rRNA processing protein RimM
MNSTTPVNKPIIIGQISGVFGVHGWVKVFSHAEPRDNVLTYSPWLIKQKSGWTSIEVIKGRKQGKTIVAQLKGVDDRDKAHALIGSDIAINQEQLKSLDDNDFYWRDLQGLSVLNLQNELFGSIVSMMATGANDVMVIKLADEYRVEAKDKEILIPYLYDDVVKQVDLERGVVIVDWDNDFE